jgi:UDP-N-acetylglucosamine--N-acetylmuramyl-(pentapeptide) pyrophosphoryl-undecaprenol N-acetylglucosamine transferase
MLIFKMNKQTKNIIISGGGTGGHLFPAIAIAQALKKKDKDTNILFVGAKGKIEEKKVPEAGFNIELLNIEGFKRKISFDTISFFPKLFFSLLKSRKIIKKFKPDIAVGVGGYASGPLLKIASKMGIPTVLQEQNSFPGITNRLLAKKAAKICVAYDGLEKYFSPEKIIKTGNPVRENIYNNDVDKAKAVEFFGLNPQKKVILSLGGSGGAKTINNALANNISKIADSDVQLIWQTGKFYIESSLKSVEKFNSNQIVVNDFITRMDMAYKAADIIISRAGAGTISELCNLGKAVVLVPSPNVAEDHQTKNAVSLQQTNAAIIVKDIDADKELVDKVLELINDEDSIKSLSQNIAKHALYNSADKIAEVILDIVNTEKK